jgi:hypothetical protein
VEREVKGDWSWWRPIQGYRQQSDKGVLRWHFLANCTISIVLAGLSSLWLFLFEYLKNGLQRQEFGSADEFLSEIWEILDEISLDTLETVFREWINKLD